MKDYELFDIIKIMFERPEEWENVSDFSKKKNSFMISRIISIRYPLQVAALVGLKFNSLEVINYWQRFLSKRKEKTPFWIYTKGSAALKKVKEKKIKVSEQLLSEFAKENGYDIKSVKDCLTFFPEEILKEIKQYEKISTEK